MAEAMPVNKLQMGNLRFVYGFWRGGEKGGEGGGPNKRPKRAVHGEMRCGLFEFLI